MCQIRDRSGKFAVGCVLVLAVSITSGIAHAGDFRVLHTFHGADGIGPYGGLIADKKGNLYGTAEVGGAYKYGAVFKLAPDGRETVLYSFTAGNDGWGPVTGLVADNADNFYGTTQFGGALEGRCSLGCGTVYKVSYDGKEKVLYAFCG